MATIDEVIEQMQQEINEHREVIKAHRELISLKQKDLRTMKKAAEKLRSK